jgi:hypothetical protein
MTEEKKTFRDRIERRFSKITEINHKYAQPRIKMTPAVKLALLALRLYLLLLILILDYKFSTMIK